VAGKDYQVDQTASEGHSPVVVFECCSGLVDLVVCVGRDGGVVIVSPLRASDS
jgi:hypothetical protein